MFCKISFVDTKYIENVCICIYFELLYRNKFTFDFLLFSRFYSQELYNFTMTIHLILLVYCFYIFILKLYIILHSIESVCVIVVHIV